MTTPAVSRWGGPDGPSFRWLVLTSLWLVFVLLPNGVTTFLGFAIIGFAVLRPVWILSAFGYFFATVTIEANEELGAWQTIMGGALWVAGIAHGLSANRSWQRLLWSRIERGVRPLGRGRARGGRSAVAGGSRKKAPQRAIPSEAVGLLDAAGTNGADYLENEATAPAATSGGRRSRRRGASAAGSSGQSLPSAPVDVNTASQKALQTLPGLTRQRAKTVVAERDRLGGFSSVEQFATVAGLQPHELVRLGPALECSPRPRRARSFGRRVDF